MRRRRRGRRERVGVELRRRRRGRERRRRERSCVLGLQQQPPPACWPPWLPGSVELVVGCWGPILIPLACEETNREDNMVRRRNNFKSNLSLLG